MTRAVLIRWLMCITVVLVLAGCGAAAHKKEPEQTFVKPHKVEVVKPRSPDSLPFLEPEVAPDQSLTPDIVYSILVAEASYPAW